MKNLIALFLILTVTAIFALPRKGIKSHNRIGGRPEGRIIKGKDGTAEMFPYNVFILLIQSDLTKHSCSGSLLSNEWVLTAAHCLEESTIAAFVLFGGSSPSSAEIGYYVTHFNFIIHEGYDAETLENDIAMIKIPYTNYSPNIQPIQLPARSQRIYHGESVIATGWSDIGETDSTISLKWGRFRILSYKVCSLYFDILPTSICTAPNKDVNICGGDSGGALVSLSKEFQIGILSYSNTNCTGEAPAVYTLLTYYLDWIEEVSGISSPSQS